MNDFMVVASSIMGIIVLIFVIMLFIGIIVTILITDPIKKEDNNADS